MIYLPYQMPQTKKKLFNQTQIGLILIFSQPKPRLRRQNKSKIGLNKLPLHKKKKKGTYFNLQTNEPQLVSLRNLKIKTGRNSFSFKLVKHSNKLISNLGDVNLHETISNVHVFNISIRKVVSVWKYKASSRILFSSECCYHKQKLWLASVFWVNQVGYCLIKIC